GSTSGLWRMVAESQAAWTRRVERSKVPRHCRETGGGSTFDATTLREKSMRQESPSPLPNRRLRLAPPWKKKPTLLADAKTLMVGNEMVTGVEGGGTRSLPSNAGSEQLNVVAVTAG